MQPTHCPQHTWPWPEANPSTMLQSSSHSCDGRAQWMVFSRSLESCSICLPQSSVGLPAGVPGMGTRVQTNTAASAQVCGSSENRKLSRQLFEEVWAGNQWWAETEKQEIFSTSKWPLPFLLHTRYPAYLWLELCFFFTGRLILSKSSTQTVMKSCAHKVGSATKKGCSLSVFEHNVPLYYDVIFYPMTAWFSW